MLPDALTVRSISMIPPEGGGSGGAPAGTAPLARSRARSLASSRDGRVLIRCPPASTWTRRVSAQILITRPVIAGPSQICCPATHKFPDGGTTRSSSTAQLAGRVLPAAAATSGSPGPAVLVTGLAEPAGARLAGTRRPRTWPVAGANRAAGNAMASDWCGRSALYSLRHASTAAWASSMLSKGPCSFSNSSCRVWVGSAERRGASLGWSFSAQPPSKPDGPVSRYPAFQ